MCCDNTMRMMNDFLDKTLSKNEEREIERHLAECEACRAEYNNLEEADKALRQVICEMVADIDVPGGLSDRVERFVSAGNREKTLWSRLSAMLRTPATAAAMLFVILAAGILTFNNYYDLALNKPKVVLNETGNYNDGTVISRSENNSAVVEETGLEKEARVLLADSDQAGNPAQQLGEGPKNTVVKPAVNQPDSSGPAVLPGQPLVPFAATAPEALSKSLPADEQRNVMVTSIPPGMGEISPASNSGTMEDAAADVGFNPAKPFYLPQGAVLTDVSWYSGETAQSYQAGKYYFTVSQRRFEAAEPEYDESFSGGSAVDINGYQGFIQESRPERVDSASGTITTLRWRQGEWAFSVTGDLPAEELIKVARSIK